MGLHKKESTYFIEDRLIRSKYTFYKLVYANTKQYKSHLDKIFYLLKEIGELKVYNLSAEKEEGYQEMINQLRLGAKEFIHAIEQAGEKYQNPDEASTN